MMLKEIIPCDVPILNDLMWSVTTYLGIVILAFKCRNRVAIGWDSRMISCLLLPPRQHTFIVFKGSVLSHSSKQKPCGNKQRFVLLLNTCSSVCQLLITMLTQLLEKLNQSKPLAYLRTLTLFSINQGSFGLRCAILVTLLQDRHEISLTKLKRLKLHS